MPDTRPLLIDGHLDLAMNALYLNRDLRRTVAELRENEKDKRGYGLGRGTLSFPELRAANIGISFVTVLARTNPTGSAFLDFGTREIAYAQAQGQLAWYREHARLGDIRIIHNQHELTDHLAAWDAHSDHAPLGVVLTMEGADPVVDVEQLPYWYADGLRILSLAHYGVSGWAHGTATEGGLLPGATDLLAAMSHLGIALDVTHLSDQSFSEALDHFQGPVLATHSNCRTLVPNQRQFTDDQLREIIRRDGVIGAALDAWMLQPDWIIGTTTAEITLDAVVDHIDHVCQLAGDTEHAAIGSDLDGGYGTEQVPRDLDTIVDLQRIPELLAKRGYGDGNIDAIMNGNWLRLLERVLPEHSQPPS